MKRLIVPYGRIASRHTARVSVDESKASWREIISKHENNILPEIERKLKLSLKTSLHIHSAEHGRQRRAVKGAEKEREKRKKKRKLI